jgi:hypothetical protein
MFLTACAPCRLLIRAPLSAAAAIFFLGNLSCRAPPFFSRRSLAGVSKWEDEDDGDEMTRRKEKGREISGPNMYVQDKILQCRRPRYAMYVCSLKVSPPKLLLLLLLLLLSPQPSTDCWEGYAQWRRVGERQGARRWAQGRSVRLFLFGG